MGFKISFFVCTLSVVQYRHSLFKERKQLTNQAKESRNGAKNKTKMKAQMTYRDYVIAVIKLFSLTFVNANIVVLEIHSGQLGINKIYHCHGGFKNLVFPLHFKCILVQAFFVPSTQAVNNAMQFVDVSLSQKRKKPFMI